MNRIKIKNLESKLSDASKKVSYDPISGTFTGPRGVMDGVDNGSYLRICYVHSHYLAWYIHYGVASDDVWFVNGNYRDVRIENLYIKPKPVKPPKLPKVKPVKVAVVKIVVPKPPKLPKVKPEKIKVVKMKKPVNPLSPEDSKYLNNMRQRGWELEGNHLYKVNKHGVKQYILMAFKHRMNKF